MVKKGNYFPLLWGMEGLFSGAFAVSLGEGSFAKLCLWKLVVFMAQIVSEEKEKFW